jgi:hypothetical protein
MKNNKYIERRLDKLELLIKRYSERVTLIQEQIKRW